MNTYPINVMIELAELIKNHKNFHLIFSTYACTSEVEMQENTNERVVGIHI